MNTAYQLACGCIDRTEANGIRVTLWKEHGVYHVRAHSFKEHIRLAWESFKQLGDARKAYRNMVKRFMSLTGSKNERCN